MAIFALLSQYVLETWTMRLATTEVSMEPQMMDLVQSKVWENGPKVSRKLLASITTNKNACLCAMSTVHKIGCSLPYSKGPPHT